MVPRSPVPLVARLELEPDGSFRFHVKAQDLDRVVSGSWKLANKTLTVKTGHSVTDVTLPGS